MSLTQNLGRILVRVVIFLIPKVITSVVLELRGRDTQSFVAYQSNLLRVISVSTVLSVCTVLMCIVLWRQKKGG